MLLDEDARIGRLLADLRPEVPIRDPERRVRTLTKRMADLCTPGASIAVIDHFDLVWAKGFGLRRMGAPAEVRPDTPFQAGSISKPLFALAVMRLCQDKRLDLDADIRTYLKSWRLPVGDDGWTPTISLRQLLSHTAGTTVHGFPGYPAGGAWPSLPQILDGAPPANTSLVYIDLIPGLQFRYSGGGTTIAQLAVTDVIGRPFPDLMRELVLAPLGMTDSTYEQPPPSEIADRAAVGYRFNGVPIQGDWHVYPEMAAAGLWTTAADLARLGTALMRILRGEANSLSLSQESLAAMLKPQLPGQTAGNEYVGLGWRCGGEGDAFHFGHTGSNEGFHADLCLYPATGQGAAVMINSNQGWRLPKELFRSIEREYGWPTVAQTSASGSRSIVENLAGSYHDSAGRVFRVEQHGETLLLRVGDHDPIHLSVSTNGRFSARVPQIDVRFASTSEGIPAMTLRQEGQAFEAVKIPDDDVRIDGEG